MDKQELDKPIDARRKMDWAGALEAMKKGHYVNRLSEMVCELLSDDGVSPPIYYTGHESFTLKAAWTDVDKPVLIFTGARGDPFIPDHEHFEAKDWIVVGKWENRVPPT